MKELLEQIKDAKHIEIRVESSKNLSGASAFYTYILTLHKKVSLYVPQEKIEDKYSFLAWYDKIKSTPTPSADFTILFDFSASVLYNFLQVNNIKINKKMATALYAMFVEESDGFLKNLDGTFFAICSQLIENGAEYKRVSYYLLQRGSLAQLRLKADMLLEMKLKNNASLAEFRLDDEILKRTGATLKMAQEIAKEAFSLQYVQTVHLIYNDKIIKKLQKERDFGKKK